MKQNWHTGRRVMVHIFALLLILMSHGTETFASTLAISIDQMERKANQLHVYYSLVRPGPDTTEASVVTFPSATAVIPEGREPIDKVILVRKQLSERWEMRTNTELDKIWTIRFSLPVGSASVNTNNIYVMEAGTVVPTTIAQGADPATYRVTPVNKYQRGHSYSLHVSQDIYSLAVGKKIGQRIKMGIIVPFTTEGNFYN